MDNTRRDGPRPVATGRDNDFILSLDEVSQRYAQAGHPRTIRTLQRYCASGHLDAQKLATTTGDKYLVTPQSVARHVAQIKELQALGSVATDRDASRPAATSVGQADKPPAANAGATTEPDRERHAAGEPDVSGYVTQLEKRIEEKDDVIGLLKGQLVTKDKQLGDLSDRFTSLSDRFADTQKLIGAMQRMFAPLLGQSDPYSMDTEREVAPRAAQSVDKPADAKQDSV